MVVALALHLLFAVLKHTGVFGKVEESTS
jgi:hypothetical protein